MRKILLALLLHLCLSVCAFGQNKNQELYKAITTNKEKQVAQLLRDGADANYVMEVGTFKMGMLAAAVNISKNVTVIELLLKNKADVNWKDSFNSTALMYAASQGSMEMVELLLAYGADIKANDGQGNTVLSAAKESRNKDVIKLLEKKLQEQE